MLLAEGNIKYSVYRGMDIGKFLMSFNEAKIEMNKHSVGEPDILFSFICCHKYLLISSQ